MQLATPSSNLALKPHADFETSLKQAISPSNTSDVLALMQHKALQLQLGQRLWNAEIEWEGCWGYPD
jgi:hypothetical protein